jgi:hypothetical protein
MMLSSRRCTATSWLTKKIELETSFSTDQGGGKRCAFIKNSRQKVNEHRGHDDPD